MRTYLTIVASACLACALVLTWRRLSVALRGANAAGRVIAFETREDDGSKYYLPVVTFIDYQGRRHRFTSVAGRSSPTPPVGSDVTVRYLPHDPATVYITSFLHMWAAPIGLAVLGAGAVFAITRW